MKNNIGNLLNISLNDSLFLSQIDMNDTLQISEDGKKVLETLNTLQLDNSEIFSKLNDIVTEYSTKIDELIKDFEFIGIPSFHKGITGKIDNKQTSAIIAGSLIQIEDYLNQLKTKNDGLKEKDQFNSSTKNIIYQILFTTAEELKCAPGIASKLQSAVISLQTCEAQTLAAQVSSIVPALIGKWSRQIPEQMIQALDFSSVNDEVMGIHTLTSLYNVIACYGTYNQQFVDRVIAKRISKPIYQQQADEPDIDYNTRIENRISKITEEYKALLFDTNLNITIPEKLGDTYARNPESLSITKLKLIMKFFADRKQELNTVYEFVDGFTGWINEFIRKNNGLNNRVIDEEEQKDYTSWLNSNCEPLPSILGQELSSSVAKYLYNDAEKKQAEKARDEKENDHNPNEEIMIPVHKDDQDVFSHSNQEKKVKEAEKVENKKFSLKDVSLNEMLQAVVIQAMTEKHFIKKGLIEKDSVQKIKYIQNEDGYYQKAKSANNTKNNLGDEIFSIFTSGNKEYFIDSKKLAAISKNAIVKDLDTDEIESITVGDTTYKYPKLGADGVYRVIDKTNNKLMNFRLVESNEKQENGQPYYAELFDLKEVIEEYGKYYLPDGLKHEPFKIIRLENKYVIYDVTEKTYSSHLLLEFDQVAKIHPETAYSIKTRMEKIFFSASSMNSDISLSQFQEKLDDLQNYMHNFFIIIGQSIIQFIHGKIPEEYIIETDENGEDIQVKNELFDSNDPRIERYSKMKDGLKLYFDKKNPQNLTWNDLVLIHRDTISSLMQPDTIELYNFILFSESTSTVALENISSTIEKINTFRNISVVKKLYSELKLCTLEELYKLDKKAIEFIADDDIIKQYQDFNLSKYGIRLADISNSDKFTFFTSGRIDTLLPEYSKMLLTLYDTDKDKLLVLTSDKALRIYDEFHNHKLNLDRFSKFNIEKIIALTSDDAYGLYQSCWDISLTHEKFNQNFDELSRFSAEKIINCTSNQAITAYIGGASISDVEKLYENEDKFYAFTSLDAEMLYEIGITFQDLDSFYSSIDLKDNPYEKTMLLANSRSIGAYKAGVTFKELSSLLQHDDNDYTKWKLLTSQDAIDFYKHGYTSTTSNSKNITFNLLKDLDINSIQALICIHTQENTSLKVEDLLSLYNKNSKAHIKFENFINLMKDSKMEFVSEKQFIANITAAMSYISSAAIVEDLKMGKSYDIEYFSGTETINNTQKILSMIYDDLIKGKINKENKLKQCVQYANICAKQGNVSFAHKEKIKRIYISISNQLVLCNDDTKNQIKSSDLGPWIQKSLYEIIAVTENIVNNKQYVGMGK